MTSSVLVLTTLVALQAAPIQAPPADPLAEAYFLFLQGRTREGRGDAAGAIAAYREALARMPEAADVRAELAALYARLNDVDRAVTEAERALETDPDNREANRILGFIQALMADQAVAQGTDTGLTASAIGHLTLALAGGVSDPGVQLTLGRLQVRSGDHEGAVVTLSAFLLEQPGYPEALTLLADAHEAIGQYADAAAAIDQLASDDPEQLRTRVRLAELHERAGSWREAARVWMELSTVAARPVAYRIRYATALVNSGSLEEGRDALLTITREEPDEVAAWYLLSQVERRVGNADGAERAARAIAVLDPDDPRGLLAMAEAQAAAGDFAAVVALLEARTREARQTDRDQGVYGQMAGELAVAYLERGQTDEAVALLEGARRLTPDDDALAFELGAAYEQAGLVDRAEQLFRQVVAAAPNNAAALNYLGYMLANRNERLDEAVGFIERALRLEPDNPSFLDSLGWARFHQGELALAIDLLQRAATAMPQVSVVQDHLGDTLFRLERYREAAAAFARALGGDRDGIDVPAVTRKRDRARELAGGE